MTADLAALGGSAAAWIAGMNAFLRAQAAAIRRLPMEAITDRDARAAYTAAVNARPADALHSRHLYAGFAALFLFFLALTEVEVALWAQLAACGGLSAYWTHLDLARGREIAAATPKLPSATQPRRLRLQYIGWLAVTWFAFLTAALFSARLLALHVL